MNEFIVIVPTQVNNTLVGLSTAGEDLSHMTRPVMLKDAYTNNQVVLVNTVSGKCRRVMPSDASAYVDASQVIKHATAPTTDTEPIEPKGLLIRTNPRRAKTIRDSVKAAKSEIRVFLIWSTSLLTLFIRIDELLLRWNS